jgi:glycosyltransferase involved in cell wall biosynthesis
MQIVHVIAGPYPAFRGSQVLVAQLVAGLGERGHGVGVVSYGRRLAASPGFHAARVPLDVALAVRLWRYVRAHGTDVVHAHNYEAGAAALLVRRATGVPVVFHGHSVMAEEMPLYAPGGRRARALGRIGRALDRTIPRAADACLAVTDELAATLRGAGATRVARLVPCLHPAEAARHAHGAEAPAPVVAYAGNLDPYQNLHELVDALRVARARVPEARLQILTHPDARRAAGRLWPAGPPDAVEIVFAASYEDVSVRLAAAQVVVVPRREATGFPMKLLNYMAAGKAIVATTASGKGLRDGETARLVAEGDPAALGAAVADLLASPPERQRLGAAARVAASDARAYYDGLGALECLYDEVSRHD